MRHTLLSSRMITLALVTSLCAACGAAEPTATPTAVPTATVAASAVPTATQSATPTASPTLTQTSTDTPTATPEPTATATPTVTPTATPSPTPKAADRLPKGPNLAFQLTIGEEELTQLVMGEAAQIVDAEYEGVAVKIHPDKIVVRLFAKFTVAGLGLDIEAEGVPVVVDGTVRFPIHRLTMEDAYQQLTEWVTLSVSNTMGRALYFLQPQREADIRAVHFTVTGVQLQEGAMVIEGITE